MKAPFPGKQDSHALPLSWLLSSIFPFHHMLQSSKIPVGLLSVQRYSYSSECTIAWGLTFLLIFFNLSSFFFLSNAGQVQGLELYLKYKKLPGNLLNAFSRKRVTQAREMSKDTVEVLMVRKQC